MGEKSEGRRGDSEWSRSMVFWPSPPPPCTVQTQWPVRPLWGQGFSSSQSVTRHCKERLYVGKPTKEELGYASYQSSLRRWINPGVFR